MGTDVEIEVRGLPQWYAGRPHQRVAIHCTQTRGGQHNDAGLVDIIPQPREAGSNWS